MEIKQQVQVGLTTSYEDWIAVRECFVQAFNLYPLYKYMVPDESKREDFLRAYLEANYEVTVGSGQGILLAVKLILKEKNYTDVKIVGGIVCVLPSTVSGGWVIEGEGLFWKAYKRHGLDKICREGLNRAFRYESWEHTNIGKKVIATGISAWSGLFCAMLPAYSSQGFGTAVYQESILVLQNYWIKKHNLDAKKDIETLPETSVRKKAGNVSKKGLHDCGEQPFSNESNHTDTDSRECKPAQFRNFSKASPMFLNSSKAVLLRNRIFNSKTPVMIAITHSEKAARFHHSNGFFPVLRTPFHDHVEQSTPFFVYVLVLDPFLLGRYEQFKVGLMQHFLYEKEFYV